MNLQDFKQVEITEQQFDLLPDGADIWASPCTNKWVSNHGGTLVLSVTDETFVEEDNEWRCLPMKHFKLEKI
jgi:hypothetical protein